jgi:hypothetical protein
MTPEDAERELGRFFAHGLLEFQRVGVHELVAAIAQLIEGEPFLCPPPAAAAYVAQLLAAIDPHFPPRWSPSCSRPHFGSRGDRVGVGPPALSMSGEPSRSWRGRCGRRAGRNA